MTRLPSQHVETETRGADAGAPATTTTTTTTATTRRVWLSLPAAAAALCLGAAALRGWTLVRGYFYIDDFAFTGRATEFPLLSWDYLSHPYNSHLMPGSYAWVWLTTHAFPLSWVAVAAVVLVLQLALSYVVYRLLVELFGSRGWILVPLAVAVLSPISLPAFLWWAAAVNQLPQQLAMAAALLFLVRYLRSGRPVLAMAGPLALAGGLLFSEKTMLTVPLVVAVTVVFFSSGSLFSRVRQTLVRHRVLWAGYAVVSLPYLGYYLSTVPNPLRETPAGHDVADLVIESVFRGTVPGLIGGPWTWSKVGFAGGLADPNGFFVVASFLIVAVVVALTTAWWHRAAGAWLILLGYAAVNLALLAGSRATVIGPVIGTEYRYQTDLAVVAALALGLATMPISGAFVRADAQRLEPRRAARAWIGDTILDPMQRVGLGVVEPGVQPGREVRASVIAVVLLALSASVSTVRYDPLWVDNPARGYVTTVSREVESLPSGTVLANSAVPEDVAWGFIAPYNTSHRVLAPILQDDRRLRPRQTATEIVVPDEEGHLRRAAVAGIRARPGPAAGCGWALGSGEVTIPLAGIAPDAEPVIRIGYIASAATELTVRVNGTDTVVPVGEGLGARYLTAAGPVSALTVLGTAAGVRVCTDDITVGAPVALAEAAP